MCLPIGCLKACIGFSTFTTLLLGIAAIVCSVTIGTNTLFISSVKDAKFAIMYALIALGALLVIFSIFGFIGVCKKSSCCLTVYNIAIILFFVVFLGIGILSLTLFTHYQIDNINDYSSCSQADWLKEPNDYALDASNTLCHIPCPCDWKNGIPPYVISSSGSIRVQDCQGFNQYFSGYSDYLLAFLELIENQFNCAGVCRLNPYYLFTDVNRGKPVEACAPKIQKYWEDYGKRIGAASIVVGVLLLTVIVASCCLCCHTDRKLIMGANGYQRF